MATTTLARSTHARALLGVSAMLAGLALLAPPALAQDDTAAVPDTAGDSVTIEWSGTVPPDANSSSDCTAAHTADTRDIEVTVPAGAYDAVDVRATVTITPTGPAAETSDLILTVVRPDRPTQSSDAGGANAAETTIFFNPSGGSHTILACAFASALPTDYDGVLTLEAIEKSPQTVTDPRCDAPSTTPKFTEAYVDESRAGGEPMIITHPTTGDLLWGSHAGTTHFYTPSAPNETTIAFVENYEGQTYYYYSTDGREWTFVPRVGPSESEVSPVAGVPATGFSDPEFAVDQAGNVFVSEINLANVAVYKSTDGGHSYALVNPMSFSMSDRQWMAADREDELYMAASGFGGGPFPDLAGNVLTHFIAKSVDGGQTWIESMAIDPIVGDILIDQDRGILYSLHEEGGTLSMAVWPDIRNENGAFEALEINEIVSDVGMTGVQRLIDPTIAMDEDGNLYVTWSDNGAALRPPGIYYAYSTDQGKSWTLPHRVDPDERADVWPWITVGEPGEVTVTWLQADQEVNALLPGEAGGEDVKWRVFVATTDTGLGCAGSVAAGFTVSQASQEQVHTGTICQHGTLCQTDATDRRLGDYYSITTDRSGLLHVAVSDTRQGGAVALPLHIRQLSADELAAAANPPEDASGTDRVLGAGTESTPSTGGGLAVFGLGAMLTALAWRGRRCS